MPERHRYSITISAGPPLAIFDRIERRLVKKYTSRGPKALADARRWIKAHKEGS